ncbi:uncharacterized protein BJ212DRAFT_1296522 [Suillus subaureus]|uniref:Uncharacterized protein n=1 Tax=Suillus subaureus TaxID=48587 RepID=A0A9P7JGT7_9AGAM|nr:uncharacterized protein BJ212DRAFT_1296522 [Suillus subaureus]KAG1822460.1 hypothetical protein BJ212DRAFT_1296522 [Suillus subaureus]
MTSSQVKNFIKNFNLGKVFAVQLTWRCPAKNGCIQYSSITTHHDDEYTIPADIQVCMLPDSLSRDPSHKISLNISSTTSSWGNSFAHKASDMAQTFLPLVQGIAGVVPFASPPMMFLHSETITKM